ncbi:MAG: hypothetical protein AAGH15_16245 [Myxococcota bacterium]
MRLLCLLLLGFAGACHQSVVTGSAPGEVREDASVPTDTGVGIGPIDFGGPPVVDLGAPLPTEFEVLFVAPEGIVADTRQPTLFVLWNRCARAGVGTVLVQPAGIRADAAEPSTVVQSIGDLSPGFVAEVFAGVDTTSRPEEFQNIAYRLELPEPLEPGTYEAFVQGDWQACRGLSGPTGGTLIWTFEVR